MIQLDAPVNSPTMTVGFVDLAGFSAITEVYGDAAAVGSKPNQAVEGL